jgi:hypothetical protein
MVVKKRFQLLYKVLDIPDIRKLIVFYEKTPVIGGIGDTDTEKIKADLKGKVVLGDIVYVKPVILYGLIEFVIPLHDSLDKDIQ